MNVVRLPGSLMKNRTKKELAVFAGRLIAPTAEKGVRS